MARRSHDGRLEWENRSPRALDSLRRITSEGVTEVADASVTLLGRYAFDAWARRTLTAGSDMTSEGFTGHRWQASGWILLTQYRAYHSELGRWSSEEPIAADGPNLYPACREIPCCGRTPTKACFPGDRTHQQRIKDEKRGIKGCQDILAEKEKNCECK